MDAYDVVYYGSARDMLAKHQTGDTTETVAFAAPEYEIAAQTYDQERTAFIASQPAALPEVAASRLFPLPYDVIASDVPANSPKTTARSVSRGLNGATHWDPLPGAVQEGETLQKLLASSPYYPLKSPDYYTDRQATEYRFKHRLAQQSPALLHISTHGFAPVVSAQKADPEHAVPAFRQSGLVMAGANKLSAGLPGTGLARLEAIKQREDDGYLTAEEVAQLNLNNTQLVVLSACMTGAGQVVDGDGVYGVNRAFLLAGAHNVVASLFNVSDDKTSELMQVFYQNLAKGGRPRPAFKQAQQTLKDKYPHQPYYWGSFVFIGEG